MQLIWFVEQKHLLCTQSTKITTETDRDHCLYTEVRTQWNPTEDQSTHTHTLTHSHTHTQPHVCNLRIKECTQYLINPFPEKIESPVCAISCQEYSQRVL